MLNLLKSDIYLMLKHVITYVLIAVTALATILGIWSIKNSLSPVEFQVRYQTVQAVQDSADESLDAVNDENAYVDFNSIMTSDGKINLAQVIIFLTPNFLTIILTIFTSVYANFAQKTGYIKNIAVHYSNRGKLILSKFIVVALYSLILTAVFIGSSVIASTIFFDECVFKVFPAFFKILGIQYLLKLSICAVVMLFCTLTRSTSASTALGLCTTTGLFQIVFLLINEIIGNICNNSEFNILKYLPTENISSIIAASSSQDLIRAVIVGAAFTIVSVAASMIITNRRDIK